MRDRAIGVVSSGFALYLLILAMVWGVLSSGMVGKNGENIWWVQHSWRIAAFKLWCCRRFFRVLWTARRSNQSILKEINPEYSLEGLILKLKLQYFGYLMQRADAGKIEGRRRRGQQRMKWLDGITGSMSTGVSKLREIVKDRDAWHAAVHGIPKSQTRLSDWTTIYVYTYT